MAPTGRIVAPPAARYTRAMKPPRRPPSDSGRPGSGHPGKAGGGPRHGGGSGRGSPPDRSGGPRPSTPRPNIPRPNTPRPNTPRPAPLPEARPARPQGDPSQANDGAFGRDDTTLRARERPAPRPRHPERPPHGRRDAGPREAPGNSLWLYGLHAVAAALANPARHLRRLLLTEDAEAAIASRLQRPWALGVERTERSRIDYLLGAGAIHQGAALLVEPLAPPSLQSAIARPGPVLVLDQVSDPRNVGAILRAAAAFGVAAVITQDRNAPEETGALAKAASGALETVPFLRAVNIARTLVALRAAGFWVVGLDAGGGPLSGPALAQRRVALVLGSEGEGLRRLTRETCDETAAIHMPGASALLDSLNVSTAAAVALYELARR
ncbi:MAG: 23S rRNA (guanosine(2251)-2'-O)-methyltransferase RlmB [Acetobacteraceae bacterium]|nr:23S rRNA (guanosine(2251)-2'-O)-methyltransferase RlmB [Acetobacteraceae bacterium]